LAVIVENAGFGAQSAAPITRQVFDYYLQGIVPKGPAPDAPGEPEPDRRDLALYADPQNDDYDALQGLNAPENSGPFVRMPAGKDPIPARKKP
jgi:hypothetical protein